MVAKNQLLNSPPKNELYYDCYRKIGESDPLNVWTNRTTALATLVAARAPNTLTVLFPLCAPAKSDSPLITSTGNPFDKLVCKAKLWFTI